VGCGFLKEEKEAAPGLSDLLTEARTPRWDQGQRVAPRSMTRERGRWCFNWAE